MTVSILILFWFYQNISGPDSWKVVAVWLICISFQIILTCFCLHIFTVVVLVTTWLPTARPLIMISRQGHKLYKLWGADRTPHSCSHTVDKEKEQSISIAYLFSISPFGPILVNCQATWFHLSCKLDLIEGLCKSTRLVAWMAARWAPCKVGRRPAGRWGAVAE